MLRPLVLALACLGGARGASLAVQEAPPAGVLARVAVIGASLAAGFGAERSFVEVLEASLRAPHEPLLDLGDVLFFTSPGTIGPQQVSAALDAEPTLVVAIDFLFWFGYGTRNAQGGAIERESQRLELLERGLALLEEFECPLVVGDFPDMSAALGKMLVRAQIPEKATLPLLSRRLREWAAARPNTLVLPLSEVVAKLGSRQALQIGRHTFPAGTRLLQRDELHPTLDGLAATAQLACDALVQKGLAREADFVLELPALMAKLGRRAPAPAGDGPGSPRR